MSAQLLDMLVKHALEPDVVLLVAPALASVLGAARDITLAALDRTDGLAALGSVVTQQAQSAVPVPAKVGATDSCQYLALVMDLRRSGLKVLEHCTV
jgi:hypothetical protein